jgi:ABC-type glycerol-3-phosphate transport system substrate-binding protein
MASAVLEKVYLKLNQDLQSGVIHNDGRLDTETRLSERYDVSIATIRKAVGRLVDEGILERQQGRGTFLMESLKASEVFSSADNCVSIGYSPRFRFQDQIERELFGERFNCFERKVLSQLSIEDANIPDDWTDCDIVQVSNIDLHVSGIEEGLAEVPEELVEHFTKDVPEKIVEECASFAGKLLLAPFVSNPSFFYAHMPSFEKAGIPLPYDGWSWSDFLGVCRKLKAAGRMPFGSFPAAGCFFEHLLFQAGGGFFDDFGNVSLEKEPFGEMISFLKILHKEKLCVNLYRLSRSFPDFMKNVGVSMCAVGSLLSGFLNENSSEWTFLPLPKNKNNISTITLVMGWGVPAANANADRIWRFIADTFNEDGRKKFSSLPVVYPAWKKIRENWKCNEISNPQIAMQTAQNSKILPSRNACRFWSHDFRNIVMEAMNDLISPDAAYEKVFEVLSKKQMQMDCVPML